MEKLETVKTIVPGDGIPPKKSKPYCKRFYAFRKAHEVDSQ
jgi:hypothetical protein